MSTLLTVEQLSQYIHKSVTSIRSDATRNPRSLPPICRLPGTKRLLWRLEDVERWLATYVSPQYDSPRVESQAVDSKEQPRRGRPTKSMQVAMLRQSANQQFSGSKR